MKLVIMIFYINNTKVDTNTFISIKKIYIFKKLWKQIDQRVLSSSNIVIIQMEIFYVEYVNNHVLSGPLPNLG